jgi:hypothetical protein
VEQDGKFDNQIHSSSKLQREIRNKGWTGIIAIDITF